MRERWFDWVLGRPWQVVLLSLAVIATMAAGMPRLSFSNDYRMFFSEQNPQLQAFEALQDTYSKNDNVLFVVSPRDGAVFTRSTLESLVWLTKEAWQTPYSLRVDSITNFQHTEADGDDLLVRDLIEDPESLSDEELARARRIATQEPLLLNRLISPDAQHTGVNVTIQLPGKSLAEVPEVTTFVRDLAKRLQARDPNLQVHLTGIVIMNDAFSEASLKDMATLYPAMFALVFLMLWLVLRSLAGTFVTLLVILLMIVGTMGASGWAGVQLSPPTTAVPVVILTLAVADCVHILSNFLLGFHQGLDRKAALRESLRINLAPVFLTTLTTAIGFLSLNASEAPPFRDLGNMSAAGVFLAFLLSVGLLPAVLMLLPLKRPKAPPRGGDVMPGIAAFVVAHRRVLLWGGFSVGLLVALQIPRNVLNDDFVAYFASGNPFRDATEFTTDHLTGIYTIEYSLAADGDGGINEPGYLANLQAFADWYREQPGVLHVNVLADTMKRLNKNLHGDDPTWYRLPEQRDMAAQYLLLYEFSLPFGLDLNNQINVRKSATRMVVTLENLTTNELLTLDRDAQEWLAAHAPEHMQTHGASPGLMFAHISHRNIRAMLEGTLVALVLISAVLVFALRSWRLGLLSLVPNLLPIGMGFGVWAMIDGEVGLALSVVAAMTLGVVVDDTVHFLSKYLRARRENNLSSEQAVRYAFSTVGTALWVTTLVLALGFGVLALSDFAMNAEMGMLTSLTIVLALVADFLFLPPLLMRFGDRPDAKAGAADPA